MRHSHNRRIRQNGGERKYRLKEDSRNGMKGKKSGGPELSERGLDLKVERDLILTQVSICIHSQPYELIL